MLGISAGFERVSGAWPEFVPIVRQNQFVPDRTIPRVQTCFLHELINGCDIHLPDVEKRERNPELERRCQRLQKEQDNREYRRMVHNVDKTSQQQDYFSVGKDLREMNRQMVSVFNFVITVGGAFAFGYKAIEYSFNGDTFMMQMIGGLVLATVVFFADLYFLLKENS
ncbi:TM199-like protein [Mya arenaria]|uniref:TM199-like protein n=1 Tax=Mya arenaria TaxID=6604 RepID=A0ABY7E5V6_MYAAR|nr:TM199-like protein [Mya arenaria]